ncbi:peptidoglycan DD-metalloendopeptidase family protein [Ancylobacter terrae]|uniref:peptidoglycan DD-metalloendopeptidase family protein n=1 Tax=Ancylobacter sp. sgz301288 TaxID=3342077 RepID=UPI00385885EA
MRSFPTESGRGNLGLGGVAARGTKSGSLLRLSAVALLAGSAAACSADANRMSDPNANPFASRGAAPSYTGSVAAAPSGQVQAAPLNAPGGYGAQPPYPQGGYPQQPAYPAYPGPVSAAPAPQPAYGQAPYAAPAYAANPAPAPQPLYGAAPRPAAVAAAPAPLAPAPAAVAPVRAAAAGGGVHVVTSGESMISIARLYGVPRASLASANGLDANAEVRIGQRLTIPGAGGPAVAAAKPAAAPAPLAAAQPKALTPVAGKPPAQAALAPVAPAAAAAATKPVSTPKDVATTAPAPAKPAAAKPAAPAPMIAAVKPTESVDEARDPDSGMQFRWPVRGRVISGFGPKPGGQQNEGINVSVPEGTSVKAAEDGVVAYAGNELKGYGNLVLIKHANGYVTAYAHASEIDVKKGDTVKRGQTIAKAGQTGSVSSPQVHFEIRKGSQPIDPAQHLAGL